MKKILLFIFLACCSVTSAQDTIRVCTYNVLNYSQTNEDGRAERFERILKEIKPDVLILQEMVDGAGYAKFVETYRNATGYTAGRYTFHDGPETDNVIIWNTLKLVGFPSVEYHSTELRDIAEYTLRIYATFEELTIFSVHLKAGDTDEDENTRAAEVQVLKNTLPFGFSNNNIIVAGDFNFYSPSEPGYTLLTESSLHDFLVAEPVWERNSTTSLRNYTQSPRMESNAGCGGGVGGGMDDRFDFIFFTRGLEDNLVPDSYTVFGNDGQDRRNSPVNNPPNTKVSAQIADDLACASDHLPVYADFVFGEPNSVNSSSGIKNITFSETASYVTVSLPSSGSVNVTNILGQAIQTISDDGGNQHISKARFAPGVYFIQAVAKAGAGRVAGWYKFVVTE